MFRLSVLSFLAALGLLFATQAIAGLEDISYPIAELGSCANQEACFDYCNDPLNYDACMSFAKANQLLSEEEIQTYQTAEQALAENGGPGGCTDQASCETYCSDVTHMEECLNFASENGLMSEEELAEATQVLEAIQSGASLPGGCTNQDTCEAYCSQADHMEECLNFASDSGIMSEDEIKEAKAIIEKMESGETPGGCDSEETCSAYCIQEVNREECEAFFGEIGEGSEESEKSEGSGQGYDAYDFESEYKGTFSGPGGCASEEECMSYCLDPANMNECASFFGTQAETDKVFGEVVPSYEEGTEYEYEGGTEYEYEGGSYDESYNEDHYNEPSGFEGLTPEDIPLDLEGKYEKEQPDSSMNPYDEIQVTPETTEPESGGEMDASFVESIKKFISGVVTKLMT